MKLSQGEYIALEKIESAYSGAPHVAQFCVYGDSLRDYIVGLFVPELAQFAELASKVRGIPIAPDDAAGLQAAAADSRVVGAIQDSLNAEAWKAGLKGYVFACHEG